VETLTYRVRCTDEALRMALGDPTAVLKRPEPDFWVHAEDVETLKKLQQDIEDGANYCIPGPPRPRAEGEGFEVPVSRTDP